MKKSCFFLFFYSTFSFFIACEGARCAHGIILDEQTKQPLDSVRCQVLSGAQTLYTKPDGKFSVCNIIGGCMPCKPITIQISKQGYQTLLLENPSDTVFYLKR